jgi:hypothetical protein
MLRLAAAVAVLALLSVLPRSGAITDVLSEIRTVRSAVDWLRVRIQRSIRLF